jgi:hypothetical protein
LSIFADLVGWLLDWWLEEWEKQAILDFYDKHPLEGYQRLIFMMLDGDIVAVSPSSTYRVLKTAGRLDRKIVTPSTKGVIRWGQTLFSVRWGHSLGSDPVFCLQRVRRMLKYPYG